MAKKKEVVITCNATNVKAVIEGLERGMAALAKEEEKLLNTITNSYIDKSSCRIFTS